MSRHAKKLRGGRARPLFAEARIAITELQFGKRHVRVTPCQNDTKLFLTGNLMALYDYEEAYDIGMAIASTAKLMAEKNAMRPVRGGKK